MLTSKAVIGVAALLVGLGLGGAMGAGRTSTGEPAATPTVTVTTTATEAPESTPEPSDEPTDEPSDEASEAPADTSYRYGQKIGFVYSDVEVTVRVDAPKTSTNMFDKNNLEAKVTVCNRGTETIDELSAQGLGLYAEDAKGGVCAT